MSERDFRWRQSGGVFDAVDGEVAHYEVVAPKDGEPYMVLAKDVRIELADLRRHIHYPYNLPRREDFRSLETFSEDEIRALYPCALVLASLDGNAFASPDEPSKDAVRYYVPDAYETLKDNGVLELATGGLIKQPPRRLPTP